MLAWIARYDSNFGYAVLIAYLDVRTHPHASEAVPHGLAGRVIARRRRRHVGGWWRRVGGRRVVISRRRRRGPDCGADQRSGREAAENPGRHLTIFRACLDRCTHHGHDQSDCHDGSHDAPRIVGLAVTLRQTRLPIVSAGAECKKRPRTFRLDWAPAAPR